MYEGEPHVRGFALAQATSTINGRVLDRADAVLPGVTVTVTNQATGVVHTALTNGEGVYSMPGLGSGTCNVTTELPGFAAAPRRGVTVGVNPRASRRPSCRTCR
ncbi:MAG: hypothetical protein DMF87_10900 [Acidobacteria bacterium]|nr:MAG: hypothetical protein DMF87_10900 [Acidobacteriota bacterium]